jgi:hypothetical protein
VKNTGSVAAETSLGSVVGACSEGSKESRILKNIDQSENENLKKNQRKSRAMKLISFSSLKVLLVLLFTVLKVSNCSHVEIIKAENLEFQRQKVK